MILGEVLRGETSSRSLSHQMEMPKFNYIKKTPNDGLSKKNPKIHMDNLWS